MSKPRAITELLADHFPAPLEQAVQRSKKLQQLSRFIKNLLLPDLAEHCQLLNLRGQSLILACDSTVWATRLRYQIPTLLDALRQQTGSNAIVDIQIRVQPAVQAATPTTKRRIRLSTEAAYCLHQCAQSVKDPALSRALEKLAGRKKERL